MKKEFSKKWKGSKLPRKQRKYRAKAPLSIMRKFLSVALSKELREKYKKRNAIARKGDLVKVMVGKFKGKTGKIAQVKIKMSKIDIEGIQVKKHDGSKVSIHMQPSNLQILELYSEDSKRKITKEKNEISKKK